MKILIVIMSFISIFLAVRIVYQHKELMRILNVKKYEDKKTK